MKATTLNGTKVVITGTSGNNLVVVEVTGRNMSAQVNAADLVVEEGVVIPKELADLRFHKQEKVVS